MANYLVDTILNSGKGFKGLSDDENTVLQGALQKIKTSYQPVGNMGNQDIYNPVGYVGGDTGMEGEYGKLLLNQAASAMGNTGLYKLIKGQSPEQQSKLIDSADEIYNQRKAEVGGLAAKEKENQMSGFGNSDLNKLGKQTNDAVKNLNDEILNQPIANSVKQLIDTSEGLRSATDHIDQNYRDSSGKLMVDRTITALEANAIISQYSTLMNKGSVTQGEFSASQEATLTLMSGIQQKLSTLSPTKDSGMTVRDAIKYAAELEGMLKTKSDSLKKQIDSLNSQPIAKHIKDVTGKDILQHTNMSGVNLLRSQLDQI